MIYALLFAALAALSYWYWRTKYIASQVARNLAAFAADGANDSLQQGYHEREVWRRIWPGLACCVVPAAPLAFGSWGAAALGFGAMAALLAGVFARYFTPWLNLARHAARPDITEFTASPASKSWPDSPAWQRVRRRNLPAADQQAAADLEMKGIILSAWRWALVVAGVLVGLAGWVIL